MPVFSQHVVAVWKLSISTRERCQKRIQHTKFNMTNTCKFFAPERIVWTCCIQPWTTRDSQRKCPLPYTKSLGSFLIFFPPWKPKYNRDCEFQAVSAKAVSHWGLWNREANWIDFTSKIDFEQIFQAKLQQQHVILRLASTGGRTEVSHSNTPARGFLL